MSPLRLLLNYMGQFGCARSRLLSTVVAGYSPGAKTTSRPKVYALAFKARALCPASPPECTRTRLKSCENRGSMAARDSSSKGLPGEANTFLTKGVAVAPSGFLFSPGFTGGLDVDLAAAIRLKLLSMCS